MSTGEPGRPAACEPGACAADRALVRRAATEDAKRCAHFEASRNVVPGADGCAECLVAGEMLHAECASSDALVATVRDVVRLRGDVAFAATGSCRTTAR